MDYANVKDNPTDVQQLHDALEAAVKRQLMSDCPLRRPSTGGLDSSITSAIAKKYAAKTHRDQWESGRMVASTPLVRHRIERCPGLDRRP